MPTSRRLILGFATVLALPLVALAPSDSGATEPTLRIGALLPETGNLQIMGPAMIAGVKLAVQDINASGGVLGQPLQVEFADSGDTRTDTASSSVQTLLGHGADVIIGPASSSVALTVIDSVVASRTPMIGVSTSSLLLSRYPDQGLYFRMAPSDTFQGQVAAERARAQKAKRLEILALKDLYGVKLANAAAKTFKKKGGTVVRKIVYSYPPKDVGDQIAAIRADRPDAILLIGFEESIQFIKAMRTQKVLPQSSSGPRLYLVDGNMSPSYKLPKGTLAGVRGTITGAHPPSSFLDRLRGVDPNLKDYSYAAEAYDATIVAALGAAAAKTDDGPAIAARLREISSGGSACSAFAACVQALALNTDIDYQGVSGKIEFDGNGDVRWAHMGIFKYGANNRYRYDKSVGEALTVR